MSTPVYIDFEYSQSSEPNLNMVCVAWQDETISLKPKKIWLHNNDEAKEKFKKIALKWKEEGKVLISYAVTAEARSFLSLGLNPRDFNWIDLFAEFRQCQHNNNSLLYGTYYRHGFKRNSVPPSYDKKQNEGKDNNKVGSSLVDCVGILFGEYIDSQHKTAMRDLIISNKPEYSDEEKQAILDYCASDLKYLPQIFGILTKILKKALIRWYPKWKIDDPDYHKVIRRFQFTRARFSVNVAIMENNGIPMDLPATLNLIKNQPLARETLIKELNKTYPFYIRKKKRSSDLIGDFVQDYKTFAHYVESNPGIDANKWAKTETGKYETSEEYLENYDGFPEIKALRKTNKILGQLKWLKDGFVRNIGSDSRLRTFFGIFGSQTGRNQPKAKQFIFAMSSWLRALIRAKKGEVVIELDYEQQEFLLAAILSGDRNMLEAYASGDPYLEFGKQIDMIPKDGTKKSHPEARDLCKAIILGLQYGLGVENLAKRISAQLGKLVTVAETQKLLDHHKRIYRKYWSFLDDMENTYRRKKCYVLDDGWALMADNDNSLSIRNFSVQGTGAVIIRGAVDLMIKESIQIIATLHDACYIVTTEEKMVEDLAIAKICMQEAYKRIAKGYLVNPPDIRVDIGVHRWDEPFVVKKGAQMYELLKEYLQEMETPDTIVSRLSSTIYSVGELQSA